MGQPPEAIGTIKYVTVDSWIDFGSVPMSYQGQYGAVFTICSIPYVMLLGTLINVTLLGQANLLVHRQKCVSVVYNINR